MDLGPLMERYVLMDHTADMMVKAFGSTLEECFANAAFALFDQTVDLSGIGTSEETDIRVTGMDDEDRLYSFLSELLYIEDADNLILKEFRVSFDGEDVVCHAKGETLDRSRHRIRSEIKAVTYHMMEVDRDTPSVTVLFDV
jgi:SHS2 domain-containing protein